MPLMNATVASLGLADCWQSQLPKPPALLAFLFPAALLEQKFISDLYALLSPRHHPATQALAERDGVISLADHMRTSVERTQEFI